MKVLHKATRLSPLLKFAIKTGVFDSVKAQIERTDCINSRDPSGVTPLMLACMHAQEQICQYLLEQKADISLRDVNGKTALDHAHENGLQQIVALLKPSLPESLPDAIQFFESDDKTSGLFLPALDEDDGQDSLYGVARPTSSEISPKYGEANFSLVVQSQSLSYTPESASKEVDEMPGWGLEWETEQVITKPENDLSCFSEAEKLYEVISSHRPIDRDEDLSMLEIVLPSVNLPAGFLYDDMPTIRRIFAQGLVEGVLGLSDVIERVEQDIGEENAESALGIVLSLLEDAGVIIEGYRPGFHEHPVDLTDALEEQIEEIFLSLQNELTGDLHSLQIQRERFRKFDLIDRREEERLGQQMDSALRSLIESLTRLSDSDWEKVAGFFVGKVIVAEDPMITEEEDGEEISGQEEEQEEYISGETLTSASFWELVQCSRNHSEQSMNTGHIGRPKPQALNLLVKYVKSEPELADGRRILRLINNFKKAQHKLIHSNFRLVDHIAKRYAMTNLPMEDLIQEGSLGLMKAAERYDYLLGFKFSTYATWWIKQSITRAIADQARTIRIPVHMGEVISSVKRIQNELENMGQRITVDSLVEKSGYSHEKILKALDANITVIPMSELMTDYEIEPQTLEYFISQSHGPERYTFELDLKKAIDIVLDDLKPREREVIKLRFGLENGMDMTLEEIGNRFEVTRERIRQIESKALLIMSHPSRAEILKPFIDFAISEEKDAKVTGETM